MVAVIISDFCYNDGYFMSHWVQVIFIFFAFVGIWHTFILILSNIQNKETFQIDVKYELAVILFGLLIFVLYALFGEI